MSWRWLLGFFALLNAFNPNGAFLEMIDYDDLCENSDDISCDNRCISKTKQCDGVNDCADGTDEFDCDQYLCRPPLFFRCENKRCIMSAFLCDGGNDCGDFSDEVNCTSFKISSNHNCSESEWMCKDKLCIPKEWVCNGESDCLDGSDETLGCTKDMPCDSFQCHDGHCIANEWHCDGQSDCIDGSDEAFCELSANPKECTIDNRRYLCKNNKTCIQLNLVCDGKAHCLDRSDEHPNCNTSAKMCLSHGCPHECVPTPSGPLCLCPLGYHQISENYCSDLNECETYGICDQKCNNTHGSYECYCDRKYVLQDDKRTCKAHGGEAILIFSSYHNIRGYFLNSQLYYPIATGLRQAVGVAFDGHHVYWTDIYYEHESIVRAKEDGSDRELLVTAGLSAPEDLAIDWVTGNIYFTDAEMQHIGVCSNDAFKCTVLVNKDIHKPRGIVLNPANGEMYWSDWGKVPEIARSNMDGSDDISFVSNDIRWPNGLTIDYPNQRLYWTDAKFETIESILLDGTDRRVVLSGVVKHPYAIAVFEDKLYWSDWKTHSIQYCDKFTGKNHHTLIKEKEDYIYGIHIYHSALKQRSANPCKAAYCSHLCLLKRDTYQCACPEGMVLTYDGHTCKQVATKRTVIVGASGLLMSIEHQTLGKHDIDMIPVKFGRISSMTYDCKSGAVIVRDEQRKKIYAVDMRTKKSKLLVTGVSGFGGMDFDYYTNTLYWCDTEQGTIEVLSLTTNSRKTILRDLDGEEPVDLALIPEQGIMFAAFKKAEHFVHIDRMQMDGQGGRTHVIDDGLVGPVSLVYDSGLQRVFWCDSYTGSIESTSVDGDDRHEFRSLTTDPISITILGNDLFWANQKSHRIFWANKNNVGMDSNKKITLDLDKDIDSLYLTSATENRTVDHPCLKNNNGCSHLCLQSSKMVQCACPLGQELLADNKTCFTPKHCNANEFKCEKTDICIPKQLRCDGKNDCILGEDEEKCVKEHRCLMGFFECMNGECIPEVKVCDLHFDCFDNSDELFCNGVERITGTTCPPNNFRCGDGNCIAVRLQCDEIEDCSDGSDEENCRSLTCSLNEFRCKSGTCIPGNWECDHEIDCSDGSDEHEHCSPVTCAPNLFTCNNARCIDKKLHCNSVDDCGDFSDEIGCMKVTKTEIHVCEDFQFLCNQNSSICVPEFARCNGTSECPNGEDEQNCRHCQSDEFECKNRKCISLKWLCDKTDDCGDASDEEDTVCTHAHNGTEVIFEQRQQLHVPCAHGFRCKTGHCIEIKLVCDGVENCYDGSDEHGVCDTACEINNNPCGDICVKTPSGPKCMCKEGYKLRGDAQSCQDVDECQEHPSPCSQICNNVPGSYICDCYPEYILRKDRKSCKAIGDSMLIIYSTSNEIRRLSPSINTLELLFSEDIPKITGLDVFVQNGSIYYAVEDLGIIRLMSSVPNANNFSVQIGRPQKISLDWVTDNIYFINADTFSKTLRVCNLLENKCAKLLELETQDQISALVVDAVNKYIFYSSTMWWHFSSPMSVIYRCNMDGSKQQKIVSTDLGHVTGLAFDYNREILYFSDQHYNRIHAVTYDGTNRHAVFANLHYRHPTGLDLYEDCLYFLTPDGQLVKCQLYGLNECTAIRLHAYNAGLFVLMQASKQPQADDNVCRNHTCTHLCVQSDVGVRCICEDGSAVAEGMKCEQNKRMASTDIKAPVFEMSLSTPAPPTYGSKIGYAILELIIILILFGTSAFFIYKYFQKKYNSAKFDVSMHFQTLSDLDMPPNSHLHSDQPGYASPVLINAQGLQRASDAILQKARQNPFVIVDPNTSDSESNDNVTNKSLIKF